MQAQKDYDNKHSSQFYAMLNSIQNDKQAFMNHEQHSVDSIYQSDQNPMTMNGPGV